MPSSLNGIGVTFNDGTQLQSANEAGGNYIMRTFTSPTTWTKPAGLKAVKVTLVGGGGGGLDNNFPTGSRSAGSGGTTSFGAIVSATGGAGAQFITFPGPGNNVRRHGVPGNGSNGTINFRGGVSVPSPLTPAVGASSLFGQGGVPQPASNLQPTTGTGFTATTTLSGANGTGGSGFTNCNGGAGGGAIKFAAAPTIPGPVTVTVGTGGAKVGTPANLPFITNGVGGLVIVEEFF